MNQKLAEAVAKLKSGDKAGAQRLLADILRNDPQNDEAWLWMSGVVADDKRRYCIERALSLNPDNRQAQVALARLDASVAAAAPPAQPPPAAEQPPELPSEQPLEQPLQPPPERPPERPPEEPAEAPHFSLTPQTPQEAAISPAPPYDVVDDMAEDEAPAATQDRPSAWIDARKNNAMLVFLDQQALTTATVLMSEVKQIQTGFKEGASPQDLLPNKTVIPLEDIREVSELSGLVTVAYGREGKPRKTRLNFREKAVAQTVMDNLENRLGDAFQRAARPVGTGSRVIVVLLMLVLLVACVGLLYWGALEIETGRVDLSGSANTRLILVLVGLLGTRGILVIGGVLLLFLIIYALSTFRKPAQATILTPANRPRDEEITPGA